MPVSVAFISQKGGVGKSTLARALAAVAAHAKLKVTLADLDPQQRTLLVWEKTRRENRVAPRIRVEAFASSDEALARTTENDLLILDTAGQVSDATLELARRVHLVVQPTGPSVDDLHPAVLVFHALTKLGIPHERLVFALCRTMAKGEEDAAREYLTAAGYEVLPGSIPERVAYRQALNRGQALTETSESTLNKRADALMEALLEKVAAQLASSHEQKAPAKQKKEGTA
jgi:chromosome partitioning protein